MGYTKHVPFTQAGKDYSYLTSAVEDGVVYSAFISADEKTIEVFSFDQETKKWNSTSTVQSLEAAPEKLAAYCEDGVFDIIYTNDGALYSSHDGKLIDGEVGNIFPVSGGVGMVFQDDEAVYFLDTTGFAAVPDLAPADYVWGLSNASGGVVFTASASAPFEFKAYDAATGNLLGTYLMDKYIAPADTPEIVSDGTNYTLFVLGDKHGVGTWYYGCTAISVNE